MLRKQIAPIYGAILTKFHIKQGGRTIIKTTDPAKADQYRNRAGYRVLTIPVSR